MNGFERYGIERLSPTMISQWDQAPATLILKRVFGLRTKPNANMWRGDAVEAGLQFWLYNKTKPDVIDNAKLHAVDTFWSRADGEVTEETEKAAELVPQMVAQGIEALSEFSSPVATAQLRVDHFFDDLPVPFIGNMDFVLEDGTIIELKTTTRCPSSIDTCSLSHKWQAGTYATARKTPTNLVYVTAKKYAIYPVEPNHPSLKTMLMTAKAMNRSLSKHDDGADLLKALPLNVDSFYWDEDSMEAYENAAEGKSRALVGPNTADLPAQGYVTFGKHAGKHISELPESYCNWLLEPKLSNGDFFDVPVALQDAITNMRAAA
jgi:hypothetical protein